MAFPLTAVIDDFNRANGAIGGNYTIPTGVGSMNVSSNTAVAAAANAIAIRNTLSYQAVEVYATLSTKPADGNVALLFWRTVQVGAATTIDGYILRITAVAGAGNDTIMVQSMTNGVPTTIGATITQEISAGDVLGIRMIGSSIEVFRNGTSLGTRSDSTYTATGQIGIGLSATSGAWDNFGGGIAGQTVVANFIATTETFYNATVTPGSVTAAANFIKRIRFEYGVHLGTPFICVRKFSDVVEKFRLFIGVHLPKHLRQKLRGDGYFCLSCNFQFHICFYSSCHFNHPAPSGTSRPVINCARNCAGVVFVTLAIFNQPAKIATGGGSDFV